MNARRWAMRDRLVGRLQDNLSGYYDGHGVGRVRPEIVVRWHRCGWRISAVANVVHAQYHVNRFSCDQ